MFPLTVTYDFDTWILKHFKQMCHRRQRNQERDSFSKEEI